MLELILLHLLFFLSRLSPLHRQQLSSTPFFIELQSRLELVELSSKAETTASRSHDHVDQATVYLSKTTLDVEIITTSTTGVNVYLRTMPRALGCPRASMVF